MSPPRPHADVPRHLDLLRRLSRAAAKMPAGGRLGEFLRRRHAGSDTELLLQDFDGDGKFRVNLSDHIGGQIFWNGHYAIDILALADRLLAPSDTVLDIGANIGEFTVFAARRVPSGAVHAFEPMQALWRQTQANCEANGLRNVHVHPFGLGASAESIPLHARAAPGYDGAINHGMNSLYGGDGFEVAETVAIEPMDAWCERQRPTRIDLIKIDVEGAEWSVLQGGADTLRRFRPKMIVEVNPATCERAGYSPRDLLACIAGLGYQVSSIGRNGTLSASSDAGATARDVLCVPA